MSSPALCCFLCHGMVRFVDKNPSDFTNHMKTKHKALFNMELSLACSLMGEKESQNIIRQHVVLQSFTNLKKEDAVFLKEDHIKQGNFVTMEEETSIDNKSDILEGEYIEVEDVVVKDEAPTQANKILKPYIPKEECHDDKDVDQLAGLDLIESEDGDDVKVEVLITDASKGIAPVLATNSKQRRKLARAASSGGN